MKCDTVEKMVSKVESDIAGYIVAGMSEYRAVQKVKEESCASPTVWATVEFNQKQRDLISKHKEDLELAELERKYFALTGISDIISFVSSGTKHIRLKPKTSTELFSILDVKPTRDSFIVEYGSEKHTIKSPYRLDIDNGVNSHSFKVVFSVDSAQITIELPIDSNLDGFFTTGYRGVTDCEYHYFTCQSLNQISRIQLKTYCFCGNPVFKYFGGHKVLGDVEQINIIMGELRKLNF